MKVSRGASRTVLLIGRWAVKVPRLRAGWRSTLCGMLSNMAEWDRWRVGPREGLCPVLLALPGGICLVMPRVEITGELPERNVAGFDHKASSYGYHAGELVAIDYHGNVYREAA